MFVLIRRRAALDGTGGRPCAALPPGPACGSPWGGRRGFALRPSRRSARPARAVDLGVPEQVRWPDVPRRSRAVTLVGEGCRRRCRRCCRASWLRWPRPRRASRSATSSTWPGRGAAGRPRRRGRGRAGAVVSSARLRHDYRAHQTNSRLREIRDLRLRWAAQAKSIFVAARFEIRLRRTQPAISLPLVSWRQACPRTT